MFTKLSDENKKTKIPTNMNNQNSSLNNNIKNESILNTSKISNDNQQEIDNNIESLMKPSGSKEKKIYHVQNKNHPKCSTCMFNYQKDLEKNTSALSDYILNNEETKRKYYCYPNIKLLGNSRYKYTNPLLFVEDQKNNISSRSLGLLPIPLEKFHKKVKNEKDEKEGKNLYELQRSIVMFRRRQYNDHYEKKPSRNKNRDNIFSDLYDLNISNTKEINKSYINKIILIQKWWRNIILKRYLKEYNNLINEFEKKLQIILMKMALKKLSDLLIVKQILKKYCYIEKKRKKYSYNDFIEAIKKIQNNYRMFKAKNLRNSLEKNLKKNNNVQDNDNLNKNKNDDNFFNDEDYEDNNINNDNNNNNINKENNNNNNNINDNIINDNKNNDDNKNKGDNINDNAINNENNKLDNNYNINQNNNIQSNDEDNDNLENDNIGNHNSYEADDNKNDINNEINNNKNDNINNNPNTNTNNNINEKNNLKSKDKDKNLDNLNINKENDLNNKNKKDDTIPSKRNSKINQNNNIFVNIKDDNKNKNNLKDKDKINNNNNNYDNNKSKEPTKKIDSQKDNLKKIIPFNNILNKCLHHYTFKKIKLYINEPTEIIPLINKCYLSKDNMIILYSKKQEKKIIQFENIIEKTELQINVKNNYIEKIYKKPIINGNSFKYQYCFSNNPHSYMNVCYIQKIRMNEYLRHLIKLQRYIKSFLLSKKYENFRNDDDPNESFNGQITHRNNLSEKATKRKYCKDNENNDSMNSFNKDNQEIGFSFDKSNPDSKRNSKISFSNLSNNQKNILNFNTINDIKENENNNNDTNDYIQNKKDIIKINKNFQKGFFISKLIFKQTKDEIIKIQRNLKEKEREEPKGKEHIFKKPSYGNVRKINNNNNYNHDSDNFDTQSIKATVVFNSGRKKSFKDGVIYFSNSSNDKTNSPKISKKHINNNSIPKNNLDNNNPIHDKEESKNENSMNIESESLSDSIILTKIKINCSSDEEKQAEENVKEVTNFDYEDNNDYLMIKSSDDVFYITKERRKDFMKYICKIQNFYKIYFNSKKSNKNHIYINTYRKPKIKSCIISLTRIVKDEEDKLYIYNPKIKFFLYLINLFVKKMYKNLFLKKLN